VQTSESNARHHATFRSLLAPPSTAPFFGKIVAIFFFIVRTRRQPSGIRCGKTDNLYKRNRADCQIAEHMAEQQLERTMGERYQVGHIESTRDQLLGGPGPGFTVTDGYNAVVTFIYSDQRDAEAAHTLITQAIAKATSIVAAYL
jgi:hypothetical protein